MYEVRVEYEFSAAHFLRDYHGKCENLHGHNYRIRAHVIGRVLDEGGMLVDFTSLKGALKEVCDKIDHTNLNDIAEFEQNPSAERIAKYIYENMISSLTQHHVDLSGKIEGKAKLSAIDVFETDRNRATYYA